MTTYFTPSVFSAIRNEIGTLGAYQQMFHARGLSDEEALDIFYNTPQPHTMRDLEKYDDEQVYYIILCLMEALQDMKAIKAEMEIEPQN